MARKMTLREIRKYLDHGKGNRRVRISRDGHVTYYGSPDHYERRRDFWHEGGWIEDYRIETTPGIEDSMYVGAA